MMPLWNGMQMTEKCKPETYQRRTFEGLAPLTREIQHITRPILGKRGFTGIDILTYWDDIVGADLGKGIQPEKLTFDRNERSNGTSEQALAQRFGNTYWYYYFYRLGQ